MSQIIPLFKRVAQKETTLPHSGEGRIEKFFVFSMSGKSFVIPAGDVAEIASYSPLIDIPKNTELVDGVINVRGNVIPVVNLRKRLGLESHIHADEKTKVLYFSIKQGFFVGMVVDDIEFRLRDGILEPSLNRVKDEKTSKIAVVEEKGESCSFPALFIDEWIKPSEFDEIQKILDTF